VIGAKRRGDVSVVDQPPCVKDVIVVRFLFRSFFFFFNNESGCLVGRVGGAF
jgi:hypothetical protein